MAVPSKTLSCPLTDSHTEPMSNHRFQECHAISRLSAAPSAPAAHWEVHVLCPDKPLLPPSLLTLSYYWWFHWLVWDMPLLSSCLRYQEGSVTQQILLTGRRPGTPPDWNAGGEELRLSLEPYSSPDFFVFNFQNYLIFLMFNDWTDVSSVILKCNCWNVFRHWMEDFSATAWKHWSVIHIRCVCSLEWLLVLWGKN